MGIDHDRSGWRSGMAGSGARVKSLSIDRIRSGRRQRTRWWSIFHARRPGIVRASRGARNVAPANQGRNRGGAARGPAHGRSRRAWSAPRPVPEREKPADLCEACPAMVWFEWARRPSDRDLPDAATVLQSIPGCQGRISKKAQDMVGHLWTTPVILGRMCCGNPVGLMWNEG